MSRKIGHHPNYCEKLTTGIIAQIRNLPHSSLYYRLFQVVPLNRCPLGQDRSQLAALKIEPGTKSLQLKHASHLPVSSPAHFRLSPLQKHVRKVVGGFGKNRSVSTGVRKPGNMCVTDRHDTTFAVKEALNPNTTNQPSHELVLELRTNNFKSYFPCFRDRNFRLYEHLKYIPFSNMEKSKQSNK